MTGTVKSFKQLPLLLKVIFRRAKHFINLFINLENELYSLEITFSTDNFLLQGRWSEHKTCKRDVGASQVSTNGADDERT